MRERPVRLTRQEHVRCEGITDRGRETFAHVSALFHTIIGGANDVANSVMLDAIAEIRKAGLYRHGVKKACNDAVARYGVFDSANMDDMISREEDKRRFYMDYLDSVNERLRPHVFILYQSVKRVLDRGMIQGSSVKARVMTAYEMLNFAVELFGKFFDRVPPCRPVDLRRTFGKGDLTPVLRAWRTVEELVCRDCGGIDLNADRDCRLAFDIIEMKLVSEQGICESGKEALALNPERQLVADRSVMLADRKEHRRLVLSRAQEEYLRRSYGTATRREMAEVIGCGLTTLGRFARELGLTKKQEKRKRI